MVAVPGIKGVPGTTVVALVVVILVAASASKQRHCLAQTLNDAMAYLDNVEQEAMTVAAKATENFDNTCDLVASCGGSCSRQSCQPLQGDLDDMVCLNVLRNPTCSDASGNLGCTQIRVNLARPYVRCVPDEQEAGFHQSKRAVHRLPARAGRAG